MTKVKYSQVTSLKCEVVIAQVHRRSPLREGCFLQMCAYHNRLPSVKHVSIAVTNLLGSHI